MKAVSRSLTELNIALLLLGMVPLFAKGIELGAVSLIFYRSLFGVLALGGWLLLRRQDLWLPSRRDQAWTLLVGVLMGLHWITYFHAIQVSTVAVAVTAIFTYPALTVVIEPLVRRERPHPIDLALALLALAGVALIVPGFDPADASAQGVFWGVLSAVLFAFRNVLYRHTLRHVGGGKIMVYQLLVVLGMLALFIEDSGRPSGRDWALLVLLGALFTAMAHSFFVGSMRHLKAKTVSLIASLQPVYSIAAGIAVLGERPGVRTLIGAGIVFSVAVIEAVRVPGQK